MGCFTGRKKSHFILHVPCFRLFSPSPVATDKTIGTWWDWIALPQILAGIKEKTYHLLNELKPRPCIFFRSTRAPAISLRSTNQNCKARQRCILWFLIFWMFEKASAPVIWRNLLKCYLSGPPSPRISRPSHGPVLLLRKEMMPHEWVGCPLQIWATTGSSAEPGRDLIDDRIDKSQDEKACDCGTFFSQS